MAKDTRPTQDIAEVFRSHWRRLVYGANLVLGSSVEAEDAVSEAFTRALERYATYDACRASLPTWIHAIVRHEVVDRVRRRGRTPTSSLDVVEGFAGADDVAADVGWCDTRTRLSTALNVLSERDRFIIAARFGAGMTNRAIAYELGADERVVSVWLLRALKRLRIELEDA